MLLLLSELEKVLQSDVNPPLSLLHLPNVEVEVQRARGGGGGGGDHLTEVLGDVQTFPLVDLHVRLCRALDQHHVVTCLDDRAVRVTTGKSS